MARILVVDDNADERLIYSAVLHYAGHTVDQAADARNGIELAKTVHPDAILMDVHMPVMNGLLAAEILRATPATSAIPILCLTGYDVPKAHALASGCSRLLRKPVSPVELTQVVKELLERGAEGRELSRGEYS